MKEVLTGYAVRIQRRDGTAFFASVGHGDGRFFAHRRNRASAYRRELQKAGIRESRVVKVRLELKEIK